MCRKILSVPAVNEDMLLPQCHMALSEWDAIRSWGFSHSELTFAVPWKRLRGLSICTIRWAALVTRLTASTCIEQVRQSRCLCPPFLRKAHAQSGFVGG